MKPSAAANRYTQVSLETASKQKRITLLHDRVAELITAARYSENSRDMLLNKARNIVSRLRSSLRVTDETSKGLAYLYDYCYVLFERGTSSDLDRANAVFPQLRDMFESLLKTS